MAGATDNPSRRILVAIDDKEVALLVQGLLEREGHIVTLSHDGDHALNALRLGPPYDGIICDLLLPYIDGVQLIRDARATPGHEHVPLLVLSTMTTERHIVSALQAGANEYLTKPFRPAELLARLDRHLYAPGQRPRASPRAAARTRPDEPMTPTLIDEPIDREQSAAPIIAPLFAAPAIPAAARLASYDGSRVRRRPIDKGPILLGLAGLITLALAWFAGDGASSKHDFVAASETEEAITATTAIQPDVSAAPGDVGTKTHRRDAAPATTKPARDAR